MKLQQVWFAPALSASLVTLCFAQGPPLVCSCQGRCVCLYFSSPQAGQEIPSTCAVQIEWRIEVADGSWELDPHEGLAMISVDLVQDQDNPELFDIPSAAGVPAGMEGFAPPNGIGNPAGYAGTPVGEPGQNNLLQIGGAQNTFGVAGTAMGLDIDVDPGVGQSDWQTVAAGSFDLPTTPGQYTFRIESAVANVLDAVHNPPQFSPASEVEVAVLAGTFTFKVACAGDLNGDGWVNVGGDFPLFAAAYPSYCGAENYDPLADLNCDCVVNVQDFTLFTTLLGTQCP